MPRPLSPLDGGPSLAHLTKEEEENKKREQKKGKTKNCKVIQEDPAARDGISAGGDGLDVMRVILTLAQARDASSTGAAAEAASR